MNRTKIEWVKNPDGTQGYTLNSKTGCLNRTPEGLCLGGMFPCYAYGLANGRLKWFYHANTNVAIREDKDVIGTKYPVPTTDYADPFYPRWWPERLQDIPLCRMFRGFPFEPDRKGIFLDDMSDWMGDYWPREWTEMELQMMRDHPYHRIYTLTKQPQNLIKFSPFPDNCWVGVTATDQEQWDKAIYCLGFHVQAKVKFISVEPFLRPIHTTPVLTYNFAKRENFINQVIIGAQTKPYKPPKIEWVREIVDASVKAGIPYFLKDNLRKLFIAPDGEIPELRQEMPVEQ